MRRQLTLIGRYYLDSIRRYCEVIRLKEKIILIREVVDEFLADNCPHLAASISYYLLFSLFPLILALISVLGFVARSPEVEARVIEGIANFLPVSSDYITNSIQGVINARGATGIIGIIGLLWAGSSVFNAIRKSLNTAWGVRQPRPFFRERLMELLMMIGSAALLFLSLGLTTALNLTRRLDLPIWGIKFFNNSLFWQEMLALITTALAFLTFLFLYRFVPNTRVYWKDVWVGALIGALVFEIVKQGFVWYATNFAHYNLIYGPIGALIALLVWTYISAIIFLFCAKFTSVYSRIRGQAAEPRLRRRKRRLALAPNPVNYSIAFSALDDPKSENGDDPQEAKEEGQGKGTKAQDLGEVKHE